MNGIMFIEPLFNAVIEKRKTQTRRVVKEDPAYLINSILINNMGAYPAKDALFLAIMEVGEKHIKPRYKKGERVYLKEPYYIIPDKQPYAAVTVYKFDSENKLPYNVENMDFFTGWKNKMFMPELSARYFIDITDVRVERVQDIKPKDILLEGVEYEQHYEGLGNPCDEMRMIDAWQSLWDSINKPPYDWNGNPFNWVHDFKLIT